MAHPFLVFQEHKSARRPADALNDRNLGKQWHVHLLGEILATLLTEDIILVLRQLSRSKVSHIFDKTEDRHIHLIILIHVNTLSCIGKRHLLRSTYDHRTRDGECLEQGKMNVTGARRSIEDEVIQLTPVCIGNQLTVSANLAIALAKLGYKVGLLDTDIFGPSMPKMFGVEEERPYSVHKDGRDLIEPVEKYGVKLLSIGFFVSPTTATLWRGGMELTAMTFFT